MTIKRLDRKRNTENNQERFDIGIDGIS